MTKKTILITGLVLAVTIAFWLNKMNGSDDSFEENSPTSFEERQVPDSELETNQPQSEIDKTEVKNELISTPEQVTLSNELRALFPANDTDYAFGAVVEESLGSNQYRIRLTGKYNPVQAIDLPTTITALSDKPLKQTNYRLLIRYQSDDDTFVITRILAEPIYD